MKQGQRQEAGERQPDRVEEDLVAPHDPVDLHMDQRHAGQLSLQWRAGDVFVNRLLQLLQHWTPFGNRMEPLIELNHQERRTAVRGQQVP